MRLALTELRRRPGRFAVATVILTLISLLLVFLGGLLDGLLAASTAPVEVQRAEALVYSSGSQESLVRSRIDPATRAKVENLVGADRVGGLGNLQIGGRVEGRGPRELLNIDLYGYELAPDGLPDAPPAPGEVYADRTLRSEGIEVGDEILLGPARTPITVVGFLDNGAYGGDGSVWGSLDTWREATAANRPGRAAGDGIVQALVIAPGTGIDDLPAAIDEATAGATSTLTKAQAIESIPGVQEQRSTFNQIIGVTAVIAIVVVALFFALLTVERTSLYGVLKAIGASSRTLLAGVVIQALVVTAIASAIGVGAGLLLDAVIPAGSLPFRMGPSRLVLSVAILAVAAVAGSAFSFRRVMRVDPAAAIGGGQ